VVQYHTMSAELFFILGGIAFAFFFLAWFINRQIKQIAQTQKPSDELLMLMQTTNSRLEEQAKTFNERLDNAARVIMGVQKSVGEMSEIGRNMRDLQEFLRSPKLRGNIGEQVLKELLTQMLPKQKFHLQYAFKSGAIVDAAVTTSGGVIPIDSKFPMENFKKMMGAENEADKKTYEKEFTRDVKKHMDDISKKYILTDEGTIDFALMYIPSENVYYEICNAEGLWEYGQEKRVLPVCPSTFYAFLQSILMSFEGQKIESQAREILSAIRAVEKDYFKVEEGLGVLGKHLNNASNMMSQVFSSFGTLGQKISTTRRLGKETHEEIAELASKEVLDATVN